MIVKKAFNMAEMMKIPVLGIVENYSYVKCPDCGKEIKVFTANANVPFAKGICAELGLALGDSTVTAFADGEVSVSINESVRGCDMFVVQST